MINFSLNTCWRLIPTDLKKSQIEVADFQSLLFFKCNECCHAWHQMRVWCQRCFDMYL